MSPATSHCICASGSTFGMVRLGLPDKVRVTIARRPSTSSPSRLAKPAAVAVLPDQRSSATRRVLVHASAASPFSSARRAASRAVRTEWSGGRPMLRSPTMASTCTASSTLMVSSSCMAIM
jgi:hypothetical protein